MGDAADDLFDSFEDFDLDGDRIEEGIICSRCGESELEWDHDGNKWCLINQSGERHVCGRATAADGFERIV